MIFYEESKRVRYLEQEEIERLLEVCDPYLQNIVKGAILLGLRKFDLLGLRWENFDNRNGILRFTEKKKGNREVVKPLSQSAVDFLVNLPVNGEYIFVGPNGDHLKDIKRSFHTALRKAGIKDFRFHDCRHTSASWLVMQGASIKTVQEHLGHTQITTTARYAHLSHDALRRETEKVKFFVRCEG